MVWCVKSNASLLLVRVRVSKVHQYMLYTAYCTVLVQYILPFLSTFSIFAVPFSACVKLRCFCVNAYADVCN